MERISKKSSKKNKIVSDIKTEVMDISEEIQPIKVKKSKKEKKLEIEHAQEISKTENEVMDVSEEALPMKVKKSKKRKILEIEAEEANSEEDEKSKKGAEKETEETITKKVKKSKKRKVDEIYQCEVIVEEVSETKTKKSKTSKADVMEDDSEFKIDTISKNKEVPKELAMFNAIIVNLPSEVSKEELINFLSNRGIPIDGLQLNDNKYAIIETDNADSANQISALMSTSPMENNPNMKVSQLFGNQMKLSNFTAKTPVANKRVVIVNNLACNTPIEKVLSALTNKDEVVKHSAVIVSNQGNQSQMVTIEFKSAEHTDEVIAALNNTAIDGRTLSAEHKYNLVDQAENDITATPTNALIVRNLPTTATKESVMELTKKFDVSPKSIQLLTKSGKNLCYVKFGSVKNAAVAFAALKEEIVEGLRLDVRFVEEPKELEAGTPRTKLRISNLPFTVKKEDMVTEFEMAESVKMPLTSGGRSKGLCYVTFKTEEAAALSMAGVQDRIIGGRKVKCEYMAANFAPEEPDKVDTQEKRTKSKGKPTEKAVGAVLTLFNLPAGVTQKDIMAHFSNVKLFNIVKKGESFRGIAEVHFKDAEAANAAMAVPEFSLKGRVVRKELKGGSWRNGTVPKKPTKPQKKTDAKKSAESESDAQESDGDSSDS